VCLFFLQCAAAGSVFLWLWTSKKIGKKNTYYLGGSLFAAVLFFVFFLTEDYPLFVIYILGVPAGLGVGIGSFSLSISTALNMISVIKSLIFNLFFSADQCSVLDSVVISS
jgi:Na+/melibiose symporter-like transporter